MPNIDIHPLSEEEHKSVIKALSLWAERHPSPNHPVIGFADGQPITPIQLVSEVAEDTPNGKSFIRMLQVCTEVMTLSEILERFNPPKLLTL